MRRHEDCRSLEGAGAEEVDRRADVPRVEADPGLVDDDDLRAMEEAAREREPLAHSVGEGLDEPMRLLLEREDPEELAPERAHLLGRHAIETSDEVEILPTGELPVEEGVVGDVADPRFRLDGLLRNVE